MQDVQSVINQGVFSGHGLKRRKPGPRTSEAM